MAKEYIELASGDSTTRYRIVKKVVVTGFKNFAVGPQLEYETILVLEEIPKDSYSD